MKKTKSNKKINMSIIFGIYIILVLLAKVVRYTILKDTMIKEAIGKKWISDIISFNVSFKFLEVETTSSSVISMEAGGNSSFIFAILFYPFKFLGFNTYEELEILVTIFWNLLIILLLSRCRKNLSIINFIFLSLMIIILNIFAFTISKEPIQFIYFLFLFYFLDKKDLSLNKKIFWIYIVIGVSVLTFRKYYLLILFFFFILYILIYLLARYKNYKIIRMILFIFSIPVSYVILLNVMKLFDYEYYKLMLYLRGDTRLDEAVTVIKGVISSTNDVSMMIEFLLVVVRLLFPIELLKFGPQYILYFIFQTFISIQLILKLIKFDKNTPTQKITILLFIAFILTSACFEPDFGSWIRHEAVTFPLLLIIGDFCKKTRRRKLCLNENP